MGGRERQGSSCTAERSGTEDTMAGGEKADMDGLCCPLGSFDVLACDAAEGQVRIHGPTAAGVDVNV